MLSFFVMVWTPLSILFQNNCPRIASEKQAQEMNYFSFSASVLLPKSYTFGYKIRFVFEHLNDHLSEKHKWKVTAAKF